MMSESDQLLGKSLSRLLWYHYIVLASIDMIGPFASDAYLPALPEVSQSLHASQFLVSLTIQLNVLVSGLSTVLLGIMSDHIGRVKVIRLALLLFIIGTIISALAQSITILLIARVIQGFGEGIAPLAQTVIRDVEDDMHRRMRMMAILTGLRPLVVVLAPILGGVLSSWIGWRGLFYFLAVWGGITIIATPLIPETKIQDQQVRYHSVRQELRIIASNKSFFKVTLTRSFQFGAIYSMLAVLSFVLNDYFEKSEIMTGLYTGLVPLTGVSAIAIAAKLSDLFPVDRIADIGMKLTTLSIGLFIWSGLSLGEQNIWFTLIPCISFVAPQFFMTPALVTLLLEPFKDDSGFVSGLHDLVWKLVAVVTSMVTSAIFDGTPKYMLLAMAVLVSISHMCYWPFGRFPSED